METVCDFVDHCRFYEAYHPSQNPVDLELIASYCHGGEMPGCQIRRYLQAQGTALAASAVTVA